MTRGLRPGQAERLGEDGGKRAAGIIVGADDGAIAGPSIRARIRFDLGDRVGGTRQSLGAAADQLLEARARIVMKPVLRCRDGQAAPARDGRGRSRRPRGPCGVGRESSCRERRAWHPRQGAR